MQKLILERVHLNFWKKGIYNSFLFIIFLLSIGFVIEGKPRDIYSYSPENGIFSNTSIELKIISVLIGLVSVIFLFVSILSEKITEVLINENQILFNDGLSVKADDIKKFRIQFEKGTDRKIYKIDLILEKRRVYFYVVLNSSQFSSFIEIIGKQKYSVV